MTDLPLSASATFATKASLNSSPTFSGTVRGNTGLAVNDQLYLAMSGNQARLNFDVDDHLDFNRDTNRLAMTIGGQERLAVDSNGVLSSNRWLSTAKSGLEVGANGNNGYLSLDGQGTRIEFDGTAIKYVFYIGGTAVMSVDGNGNIKTRGSVQTNQASV